MEPLEGGVRGEALKKCQEAIGKASMGRGKPEKQSETLSSGNAGVYSQEGRKWKGVEKVIGAGITGCRVFEGGDLGDRPPDTGEGAGKGKGWKEKEGETPEEVFLTGYGVTVNQPSESARGCDRKGGLMCLWLGPTVAPWEAELRGTRDRILCWFWERETDRICPEDSQICAQREDA